MRQLNIYQVYISTNIYTVPWTVRPKIMAESVLNAWPNRPTSSRSLRRSEKSCYSRQLPFGQLILLFFLTSCPFSWPAPPEFGVPARGCLPSTSCTTRLATPTPDSERAPTSSSKLNNPISV